MATLKLINIKEVDVLKKEIDKWKNKKELIEYLKARYKGEGLYFHKIFLHSACAMGIKITDLKILLQFIETIEDRDYRLIESDIEYIVHLRERMERYDLKIEKNFRDLGPVIYIEDMFNYLEYIKHNMKEKGVSLDNHPYPKDILGSQFNHLLSSFSGIIEVIQILNIPSKLKEPKKINNRCRSIYEAVNSKESVRDLFLSLSVELSKATKIENSEINGKKFNKIYYSKHILSYWTEFAIYRDLNFHSQKDNILNTYESRDIMFKTKAMKAPLTNGLLRFDFAKALDNYAYNEVYSSFKLLIPIYGNKETDVRLIRSNSKFQISDFLELYSSILKLSLDVGGGEQEKILKKTNGFIKVMGEKQLMRYLGIENAKVELLRLLSFDIDEQKNQSFLVGYKPLIKRGEIYYILPTWISYVSIEKAIDKILSNDKLVKVNLNHPSNKGYLFESSIESLFKGLKIPFAKLEQDKKNGIHETDGMFMIGDYVFLFDAKATIKPENLVESYNNLQGHLFSAYKQLVDRMNSLRSENVRGIIKRKTGIDLCGKHIAPFILMNHHFFNGYQELRVTNGEEDTHIPIVDFLTLKNILKSRKVPLWIYNEDKESYLRKYIPLKNPNDGKEFYEYLLNPMKGHLVREKPMFQVTEDDVMFEVTKPVRISDIKST